MSFLSEDVNDLLDRVGQAALDGVRGVDPEWEAYVVAPATPPVGELCDTILVWLAGLAPLQDANECGLIWDAQIRVRLDLCVGVSDIQETTGLVSAEEQKARSAQFLPLLWGLVAGLTLAWRDNDLPFPGEAGGCRKLTWGPVLPAVDEGGYVSVEVQFGVEMSARYVGS